MALTRSIFGEDCKFVAGAARFDQIPYCKVPEVAFVGRSNVGKSSLINSLVGRVCARVSKTPGRTQQINFFSLKNRISLADLPGYGYAVVSKEMRNSWNDLIVKYLETRKNLKRIFLLIDSRRGITNHDAEIMSLLDGLGLVYQIILTKVDKKASEGVADSIKKELESHPAAFPEIILTSSKTNLGIRELQNAVLSCENS